MNRDRVTLEEAVKFHGHLGPYLVLGLLAGRLAIKKLKCRKYFGLEVRVWGATQRPKSCLIDGLQLSTGATYGKGNIEKYDGKKLCILFKNKDNNKRLRLDFKEDLVKRLESLKRHRDSEVFANELYRTNPAEIFNPKTEN